MEIRSKLRGVWTVTGLAALALAGAGATASGAATKSINLQSAYRATVASTSARETVAEAVESGGKRQTVLVSGVATAQGDGSFSVNVAGQSSDVVVDNGVMYLKLPPGSGTTLNVTTPWVSLNLSALTQAKLGTSYQQLVSEGQQGPSASLAILEAASSSGIRRVGTAALFGSSTTEYKTTIDLNKVPGASGKPALAPVIEKLESQYHLSSIPITVWLDSQDRVRRLVEDIGIPSSASHPSASAVITVNITAFDIPVTISPPPPGQSTDVTAQATGSSTA